MNEHAHALNMLLARVRRRYRAVATLKTWTVAAIGAAIVIALAVALDLWVARSVAAGVGVWSVAGILLLSIVGWAIFRARKSPDTAQLARFAEERCPELEDTLATAVSQQQRSESHPLAAAVMRDAADRIRNLDMDRVVSRSTIRSAGARAAVATAALLAACIVAVAPAGEAVNVAAMYLFPERVGLAVTPGDVRVRAGQPLDIVASLTSKAAHVAPMLSVEGDAQSRELPMRAAGGKFAYRFDRVEQDFSYTVTAAGTSTRKYSVTVVRPPRVQRIDLRYVYPKAFNMTSRLEEDGGDIYGPAGTRVHVSVHTDKPVTSGHLTIAGAPQVALAGSGDVLEGELTIAADGSYRVALSDADGLTNAGDTEYFIRTMDDRPPDVRIVRPASDKDVTPIEEVSIEARADDDFGVAQFELVYAVRGGAEKAIPFDHAGGGTTVNGRTTLYLEDLGVEPGDFVTYYARARDVSRGKRSTEARSDIFFLQVSPFDEEFVASQSQGSSASGDRSLDDLVEAQKNLVTATWKVDCRARDAGRTPADDVRALARGQEELRKRALAQAAQMQRNADVRRRRPGTPRPAGSPPAEASDNAMVAAAEAMLGAQQQLEALKTSPALPFEMKALNELMRAQADVRRREVQRQANGAGAGRAANRQQQDLSSLFDRELARQQQTNYETPRATSETKRSGSQDETLDKVRELANRQEALNREQQALAAARNEEERKRQLERLTREQIELRQQAEDLAQQLQQGQPGGRGQQQRTGQGGSPPPDGRQNERSRAMQGVSEQMRAAANELRREDANEASARGSKALEQLRQLEQQLRGTQPSGSRDRALGELQLESQQVADAQRQVAAGQQARGRSGQSGAKATGTQIAEEQNRLADRTERLEQSVRELAKNGQGGTAGERQNLSSAARELDRQRLSSRMRDAAKTPDAPNAPAEAASIASQLDRLAERLGNVNGDSDSARKLSEQLARVRELRDRLSELDRQLSAQARQPQSQPGQSQPSSQGQDGRGTPQPQQSGEAPGQQAGNSRWDGTRQLLDDLRKEGSLGLTPGNIEGFNPGTSAPGTEPWKQDFARWDELRTQIAAALEKAESSAAARLRNQQATDRLSAGAAQSAPESYRRLVEKYYRALAAPNRQEP